MPPPNCTFFKVRASPAGTFGIPPLKLKVMVLFRCRFDLIGLFAGVHVHDSVVHFQVRLARQSKTARERKAEDIKDLKELSHPVRKSKNRD
jgi:hypothetical protein